MSAKAVVHDDYVTKADLDVFGQDLHGKIVHDIANVLDAFMERVDERFDRLEARVDKLEENFERLNNTLDAFLKRLDDRGQIITLAMRRLRGWNAGLKKSPSKPASSLSIDSFLD